MESNNVLPDQLKLFKLAKKEVKRDEVALEKARNELEQAHGEESSKLKEQIAKLEQALKDSERAISRAQLTKAGHVYVISNVGSFGEDIYKELYIVDFLGVIYKMEQGE